MDSKKTIIKTFLLALFLLAFLSCERISHYSLRKGVRPEAKTRSIPGKADEVAIWEHKEDPSKSVIIGNDKSSLGALYVYDLKGNLVSRSGPLNGPVGLSVRYNITLSTGEIVDVVACGMRTANEMKIFKIDPETRMLTDITTPEGISSGFEDRTYGLCLYKRSFDGQLFAFLSRKETDHIHQIHLEDDGKGKIKGTLVRKFGRKDQKNLVEGMVVDDEYGYLYCSDERDAILKYDADPSLKKDPFIQSFGLQDGIHGDREGLALYRKPNGKGYLIVSSQGDSTFKIYEREGKNKFIKSISLYDVHCTDGIAASSLSLPPHYPLGIFVAHNDGENNLILFDWYKCTQLN